VTIEFSRENHSFFRAQVNLIRPDGRHIEQREHGAKNANRQVVEHWCRCRYPQPEQQHIQSIVANAENKTNHESSLEVLEKNPFRQVALEVHVSVTLAGLLKPQ
jgi:hypothetical protein